MESNRIFLCAVCVFRMVQVMLKTPEDDSRMAIQVTDTLEASFQRDIRPMLDLVDKLRAQGVTEENIQLPTIVVVGDQSSGKSSVLESLAGITLPRGQGIATRVPLVLRLQSCASTSDSIIKMDYGLVRDKVINGEAQIEAAINEATNYLAGTSKDVKDTPIQLLIRKPHAPDLTMVDLPGITRVPVHGQPENIYEQISSMIMKYIKPEESIILNVLSAQVDFPTCESIRMSQQVDKEGKRTLAVVTKVDKAPEGLLEKVTTDAVNIGLGYICVRNRVDSDDSVAIARVRERELFESHEALKELDRTAVGIPALARKLTTIQSEMVRGCMPKILKQVREALVKRMQELDRLPKGVDDARSVFFQILQKLQHTLGEVVREGKYTGLPEDPHHRFTARCHEKFQKFADNLHEAGLKFQDESQTAEIQVLMREHQGVALPNFLPHSVMQLLMRKQIDSIGVRCSSLVEESFEYASNVIVHIIKFCGQGYPRLVKLCARIAEEALEEVKTKTMEFVKHMLEKELMIVFTTNDYYSATIEKMNLALGQSARDKNGHVTTSYEPNGAPLAPLVVTLGAGDKEISLEEIYNEDEKFEDAWRMKVSAAAYWKVVQKRLADEIPLEIWYALQHTTLDKFYHKMMSHSWASSGGEDDLQVLMQEDAKSTLDRSRLELRVATLKDCLGLMARLML